MLSFSDFLQVSKDAARLFPLVNAQKKCLQLQTFKVLSLARGAEVGAENFGAVPSEKDTPFFWSRAWEEAGFNPNALSFNWPALTVFEIVNETTETVFQKGYKRVYTLEVSVLDVYREDCVLGLHTGCDARPVNQIYLDTEVLLDSFFRYLDGIVVAKTSADSTPKVYYEPWLKAQQLASVISSYEVLYSLGNTLAAQNKRVQFARVEISATQKIYGTKAQILFASSVCPTVEYATSATEYPAIPFQAGCIDCT